MLNWNEVKVGETEIVRRNGKVLWNVCGNYDKWVWLFNGNDHIIESKDSITDWTIYDPWVEITEECCLVYSDGLLVVEYNGETLTHRQDMMGEIKIDSDGRRVWKRKEGRNESS